jgi:uncharacterized Tic20 family protein
MSNFDTFTAAPPAGAAAPSAEQRSWAMFCHLAALSFFVTGIGIVLGPLIVWLIKRDEMPFVDDQGKEALNFNITLCLLYVVLGLFVLVTLGIGALIVVPLSVLIGLVWLIVTIVAAIKANDGEYYRYPFALRLIK